MCFISTIKILTMKRLMLLTMASFWLFSSQIFAQTTNKALAYAPQKIQKETSDPKAKAVLDKMRKKFESLSNVVADFKLVMSGANKGTEKGKISLSGSKYRVEMNQITMICDGQTSWYVSSQNNEVQINNANESESGSISPARLLKIYENDKEVIFAPPVEASNKITMEFKPTDRSEEYSKGRMTIDKTSLLLSEITIFSKDGTTYTLTTENVKTNQILNPSAFTFDLAKFGGKKVDLR